jgi:hypothetical protein
MVFQSDWEPMIRPTSACSFATLNLRKENE